MRRRRSTTTKSGWICTSASSSTGRSTDPSSGTQTSESDGRLGCDHSVDAEQLFGIGPRSEEHTSELQSHVNLVCRLLLEKKNALFTTRYRHSKSSSSRY